MHTNRFFLVATPGSCRAAVAIAFRGLMKRPLIGLIGVLVAGVPAPAADDAAPQPFVPGDISVGDPIVLPSAVGPAASSSAEPPAVASPADVPGNGWIGLVIDESRTPGRWVVAEVKPESPAATAGIRVGDEVRAINGTVLRTADDVAQALTAIAPGQPVVVAIARDEAIDNDVRMNAVPRPAPQPPREWQAGQAVPADAAPERFAPREPPPAPPTSVVVPPAAAPTASAFAAAPPTGFAPAMPAPVPVPGPAPFSRVPPPALPAPLPAPATGRGRTALGVRTMPIDPAMQARFRLPAPQGAYVIGVVQDLPAARAGLPPGSVIVALDARPVGSPDELTRLVTSGPVGRPVAVEYVLPGGEARKAEVVLQPLELPMERALVGPEPVPAAPPALLPSPSAAPVTGEAFPYRSNRPADPATLEAARAEIRRLRSRLDALERIVGPTRD